MRRLHYFQLSPFCRKVRLVLAEKRLGFEGVHQRPWDPRAELMPLDPSGQLPVLVEDDGPSIADSQAICEYLEEIHPDPPMLPKRPAERAEVRRIAAWFDRFFYAEVSSTVVREKLLKRYRTGGGASQEPNLAALRASLEALRGHLEFVVRLVEQRDGLAGPLGLADYAAAAHLSCIDYFGDVPWDDFPQAQVWYARIKSRPSFRPLLADQLPGFPPAPDYANLDF